MHNNKSPPIQKASPFVCTRHPKSYANYSRTHDSLGLRNRTCLSIYSRSQSALEMAALYDLIKKQKKQKENSQQSQWCISSIPYSAFLYRCTFTMACRGFSVSREATLRQPLKVKCSNFCNPRHLPPSRVKQNLALCDDRCQACFPN